MTTFAREILSLPLLVMCFMVYVESQFDNDTLTDNVGNITSQFTCMINNKTYIGDECLEGLSKFGRVVSWILTGFLLVGVACCCGCWCCICKIILGKKSRPTGGVVLAEPHNSVITTVA